MAWSTKLLSSIEEGQLHQEDEAKQLTAELADKVAGAGSGATGCNEIIDDDDLLTRLDTVALQLEEVLAVLLLKGFGLDFAGKLALFADWHEAGAKVVCKSGTKEESARLKGNYDVRLLRVFLLDA